MSNWLYQTPDKQYAIGKQNDPEWFKIFGDDVVEYLLCKYDKSLADWNKKNPKSHLLDYYIFRSEETFKDCIDWLIKNKKITQEEYDEWIWKTVTDLDKLSKL